jgi:hypothetical protein
MKTKEEYPLIPMSEITDEAREIAVAWMECEDKNWIGQKHKLASDIMNYSKKRENQTREEMFLNMQYYYEYCLFKGYVTPQEWIEKHKHF